MAVFCQYVKASCPMLTILVVTEIQVIAPMYIGRYVSSAAMDLRTTHCCCTVMANTDTDPAMKGLGQCLLILDLTLICSGCPIQMSSDDRATFHPRFSLRFNLEQLSTWQICITSRRTVLQSPRRA